MIAIASTGISPIINRDRIAVAVIPAVDGGDCDECGGGFPSYGGGG